MVPGVAMGMSIVSLVARVLSYNKLNIYYRKVLTYDNMAINGSHT